MLVSILGLWANKNTFINRNGTSGEMLDSLDARDISLRLEDQADLAPRVGRPTTRRTPRGGPKRTPPGGLVHDRTRGDRLVTPFLAESRMCDKCARRYVYMPYVQKVSTDSLAAKHYYTAEPSKIGNYSKAAEKKGVVYSRSEILLLSLSKYTRPARYE